MAIDADVKDRLLNYKFNQAKQKMLTSGAIADVTTLEHDLIIALANAFGDSGWFEGDMAVIVAAALSSIGV